MNRECIIKLWEKDGNGNDYILKPYKGILINWGLELDEDSGSNYTIGIVELENGSICTSIPDNIIILDTCPICHNKMDKIDEERYHISFRCDRCNYEVEKEII